VIGGTGETKVVDVRRIELGDQVNSKNASVPIFETTRLARSASFPFMRGHDQPSLAAVGHAVDDVDFAVALELQDRGVLRLFVRSSMKLGA
jgi:hypothetical protein